MDAKKITDLINMAAEGVGKSEFGPLMTSGVDDNQTLKKNINPVCFQIFLVVLGQIVHAECQIEREKA